METQSKTLGEVFVRMAGGVLMLEAVQRLTGTIRCADRMSGGAKLSQINPSTTWQARLFWNI
eukprot:113344-Amorphochlora_amoeboformis.AAC.2